MLTQKLVVLLLQLGAYRLQTISVFTVDNMTSNDSWANFSPIKVLKQSWKGRPLGKFEYRVYKY